MKINDNGCSIWYLDEDGFIAFSINYGEQFHIKTSAHAKAVCEDLIKVLWPLSPILTAKESKESKARNRTIANMAMMIFAHNPNEFNEIRAVQAARRIYEHSHNEQ